MQRRRSTKSDLKTSTAASSVVPTRAQTRKRVTVSQKSCNYSSDSSDDDRSRGPRSKTASTKNMTAIVLPTPKSEISEWYEDGGSSSSRVPSSADNAVRRQERDLEFTAELISYVQRSPILFDHGHRFYRNVEKKVEAWNYIREKLGYLGDSQELADYWKILRDRYTKARRKVAEDRPTKFRFLYELKFLDPHIIERSSWYEKSVTGVPLRVSKTPTIRDSSFYLSLIDNVRKNPCFYNSEDPNYRRYQLKVKLWNDICRELKFEGGHTEIYKQWKKLRDRFVREVRKMRLAGRARETCKWEYFSEMEWMEPFIEEPKPLEDFEMKIEVPESSSKPMPIFKNGKKTAEIRILKPVVSCEEPPALEPRTLQEQVLEEATNCIATMFRAPNITESEDDDEEIDIDGDDDVISTEYEMENPVTAAAVGNPASSNFCPQVLLNVDGSQKVRAGDYIYGVSKDSDLSTLPPTVREAIRSQGKDAFKDKKMIFIKS